MHRTELYRCNANCEAVTYRKSQRHSSSSQRTVKLSKYFKIQQSTVSLFSTLRRTYEMPCRATQAMAHPAQLSASNTGNRRNCLGRAEPPFPSAPRHPEWLNQGCKMEDLPTCFISPLWSDRPCSYLIPFAYHHSGNNQKVETTRNLTCD